MRSLKRSVVAIVGLGQIGASIGRALIARRACRRVLGVSRKASTLRTALRLRAAHEVSRDLRRAYARADIVILAAPVRTILRQIPAAAAALRPGTLLLDVGSTKGAVLRAARRACPRRGVSFVGGHPMAGGTGTGPESSSPRLLARRPFVLVPGPGCGPSARATAIALVRAIGSRPLFLSADAHDRTVALISHLPHLVAITLMKNATAAPRRTALRLAAGSFRSATRVALTDPEMLLDILLTNSAAIDSAVRSFHRRLESLRLALQRHDESFLRRILQHAGNARRKMDSFTS